MRIARDPALEVALGRPQRCLGGSVLECRRREVSADPPDLVFGQPQRAVADAPPLLFHLGAEASRADLVHKDLNASLELVVTAAVQIVDAQHRLEIAQEIGLGQFVANALGDDGRAPLAAADENGKAETPVCKTLELKTDVVHAYRRAIPARRGHRYFELARQKAELGVQR